MIANTLSYIFLYMLIACVLILLAGWAYDFVSHDILVGQSQAPSTARAPAGPTGFAAHGDLAGWDWPRGVNQIGLRDLEEEGWWG
jgi:hypothetical protein